MRFYQEQEKNSRCDREQNIPHKRYLTFLQYAEAWVQSPKYTVIKDRVQNRHLLKVSPKDKNKEEPFVESDSASVAPRRRTA